MEVKLKNDLNNGTKHTHTSSKIHHFLMDQRTRWRNKMLLSGTYMFHSYIYFFGIPFDVQKPTFLNWACGSYGCKLCNHPPNCKHCNIESFSSNPLHPKISMHIFHTVLSTFSKMPIWRICLTIKSFFSGWSPPLFSWP